MHTTAMAKYIYCGLRTGPMPGQIDPTGFVSESLRVLSSLTLNRKIQWRRDVLSLAEPSIEWMGMDPWKETEQFKESFKHSSPGHKLFGMTLINLLAHLRNRALVLFDEPETYLHPSLLEYTLRLLRKWLREKNSFALVAIIHH